jgi:hypothetical protein
VNPVKEGSKMFHNKLGMVYLGYYSERSQKWDVKKATEDEEDEEYSISIDDIVGSTFLYLDGEEVAFVSPQAAIFLNDGDEVEDCDIKFEERCKECLSHGGQHWCGCTNTNIQFANIKGPCGHFH